MEGNNTVTDTAQPAQPEVAQQAQAVQPASPEQAQQGEQNIQQPPVDPTAPELQAATTAADQSQQPEAKGVTKEAKEPKKPQAVLLLGRFQGVYLSQTMAQPVTIPFPPEIIRDMDVVNRDALADFLKAITEQMQLTPSELTLLLADDILFVKQFPTAGIKTSEKDIQTFVDSVPFEEQAVTKMPAPPNTVVAVSSREYFEAFEDAFKKLKFAVTLIFPAFVMAKEANLSQTVDINTLSTALHRAPAYHQYNLFQKEEDVLPHAASPLITKDAPKDKTRLYIMIGVFGILLVVLFFVYRASNQPLKPTPKQAPQASAPTAGASTSPTPAASSSAEASQSAKIQYVTEKSQQATTIQIKLQAHGITVDMEETPSLTGSGSLAVFSSSIPAETKQAIVTDLQQIEPSIKVQDTPSSSVGIQITLTK